MELSFESGILRISSTYLLGITKMSSPESLKGWFLNYNDISLWLQISTLYFLSGITFAYPSSTSAYAFRKNCHLV